MPIYQVPDWKIGCRFLYGNRTEGLVDGFGNPMTAFDNVTTWGIDIHTCYKYCSPDKLQQVQCLPYHIDLRMPVYALTDVEL